MALPMCTVLVWFCAKPENTPKPLCVHSKKSTSAVSGAASDAKSLPHLPLSSMPPVSDSVKAVHAYCAEAANKPKPLCVLSKVKKTTAGGGAGTRSLAAKAAGAVPGAPVATKLPGSKSAKKAAKKAKKADAAAGAPATQ